MGELLLQILGLFSCNWTDANSVESYYVVDIAIAECSGRSQEGFEAECTLLERLAGATCANSAGSWHCRRATGQGRRIGIGRGGGDAQRRCRRRPFASITKKVFLDRGHRWAANRANRHRLVWGRRAVGAQRFAELAAGRRGSDTTAQGILQDRQELHSKTWALGHSSLTGAQKMRPSSPGGDTWRTPWWTK